MSYSIPYNTISVNCLLLGSLSSLTGQKPPNWNRLARNKQLAHHRAHHTKRMKLFSFIVSFFLFVFSLLFLACFVVLLF